MRAQRLGRHPGRRPLALLAALTTAGGVLVAAPLALATPTPPPNPSQGQISAAQSAKNALAGEVGRLSGQIAAAQSALAALQGRAEMAEQKVAFAVSKKQAAARAAARAQAQVQQAARTVDDAHTTFVRYLQSSYMTGTSDTSTGTLLTAKDPSTLLQQTTLERYEAEDKVDAISTLQTATVTKSNADAAARRATLRAKKAAREARREKTAADEAVTAQAAQEAALQQTLSSSQTQLISAQSQLSVLNHQHTQFLAYQAHQRLLAEQARQRKLEQERQAKLAHERLLKRQAEEREREREQRAREREQRKHQDGGGSNPSGDGGSGTPSNGSGNASGGGGDSGGGGNNGGGSGSGSPPSSGGGWTPAKGRYAVQRAKDWLGEPYSWAGGGSDGPSYGVCAPGDAYNDCNVKGFDCSGLAMYAWGPYLSMDHYAKLQYNEAGSKHPSASHLRPGDLVFYSYNGSVSGIHHVAIYIGGGEIIQAPYSGSYVQISSVYDPGSIFGATRPLT